MPTIIVHIPEDEPKARGITDALQQAGVAVWRSGNVLLANPFARAGNPNERDPASAGDEDLQMLSQPYAQKFLTSTLIAFNNILTWMSLDEDLLACGPGEP